MQPNQPNQPPQNPMNQQPQVPNGPGGNPWDFLYSQPEPPKKKSFFQENKKLIIVAISVGVLLIFLMVVTAVSSNSGTVDQSQSALETPVSEVEMTKYSGQYFSVEHASSLKINIDEALTSSSGWFLHFAEDPEYVAYDLAIQVGDEEPQYDNGSLAVEAFLAEQEYAPDNVTTSAAVVAGVDSLKTVGEYTTTDGQERYVVYATAQVKGEYVIVDGTYPKNNSDIAGSFDKMIASIRVN